MSAKLFRRAARCYHHAGLDHDACRCFQAAGDPRQAAFIHEAGERWEAAAVAFDAAGLGSKAARCWLALDRPEAAVTSLLAAGDTLEAAWLAADRVGPPQRARDLLADQDPAHPMVLIIQARCGVGRDAAVAAQTLRRFTVAWPDVDGIPDLLIHTRAVQVADHLQRPDLAALIHAAAWRAGVRGAADRWRQWALDHWGDAAGIPTEPAPPVRRGRPHHPPGNTRRSRRKPTPITQPQGSESWPN